MGSILSRESDYQRRHRDRKIDLDSQRYDPFAQDAQQPGSASTATEAKTYKDIMAEQQLERERAEVMRQIQLKQQQERIAQEALARARALAAAALGQGGSKAEESEPATKTVKMDPSAMQTASLSASSTTGAGAGNWGETPAPMGPGGAAGAAAWAATPVAQLPGAMGLATPMAPIAGGKSGWDEAPGAVSGPVSPFMATPMTSSILAAAGGAGKLSAEELALRRIQMDIDQRNRPYTDEELDEMFPEGFVVVPPPKDYVPIRTPSRKLLTTPAPEQQGFVMPATPTATLMSDAAREAARAELHMPPGLEDVPFTKEDDLKYFGTLLEPVNESELSLEEQKRRQVLAHLLKIKNGPPPKRKSSLRHITERARYYGANILFDCILPLFLSEELDDQERHFLVKTIDRILYKLDDLVRPHAHKILTVVQPMLQDSNHYTRMEGREIIANLAKAAGLAWMVSIMRPDIDKPDEYVRNATARALAVVASALGVHALLPFIRAVTTSKKSWEARHTGIKTVQQIAILMGCSILPHLNGLVAAVAHGLTDERDRVRYITGLAIAALAEAAYPYGLDAFEPVIAPLLEGLGKNKPNTIGAFLKAIGQLATLMSPQHAAFYVRRVMPFVVQEFSNPNEERKHIVLTVLRQCVNTNGVDGAYLTAEVIPIFFEKMWHRRTALSPRLVRPLIDTLVELATRVGTSEILTRIVTDLKDANEPFRRLTCDVVAAIISKLGVADVDKGLEERLMDGILFAYQAPAAEEATNRTSLYTFGVVFNALGQRASDYVSQLCGVIKWQLAFKVPKTRQMGADLFARTCRVMVECGFTELVCFMGNLFFENLGEEFPDVLASIIAAIKAVFITVGPGEMKPPVSDLLPALTPILKNKHERVQENVIDLIGRIADTASDDVSPKEWMRICFDLLDLLRAPKKSIRRTAAATFGFIAKAVGPQEVLVTLLNNLKVQDRTNRVTTTVAIAIVAEICGPFTVLPALMNEYRVPENNVQNGVLKSLSFLFEYIGEVSRDYVYAVTTLLVDALTDRDLVHRQTACAVVKHIALGVYGLNREDVMIHLLNYVWPNIFETSPHMVSAVTEALEGIRLCIGPAKFLLYLLPGLFHPARKVRAAYWRVYNSLYVASQDALVAAYPTVPDDENNQYRRWDLELIF